MFKSNQNFFTATNNVETSHINSSTLTLIASDFCWQGLHCWLGDNKAVHWEPRPNNCIVHVQALSWGPPEYYLELLPSCCPLLLRLYGELLIVWQDWQAPLQSWLKALRSEKWDRYRANTCPLAVSESPTGCALHWQRINGSIKKPTYTNIFSPPLPQLTVLLWLANNPSPGSPSFSFTLFLTSTGIPFDFIVTSCFKKRGETKGNLKPLL